MTKPEKFQIIVDPAMPQDMAMITDGVDSVYITNTGETKPDNFPESVPETMAALEVLFLAMRDHAIRQGKTECHIYKIDGKATIVCHLDLRAMP